MKKISLVVLLAFLALSGCSVYHLVPQSDASKGKPIEPVKTVPVPVMQNSQSHWVDVARIRDEATRLSYQVSQGEITKVQAAQYLNQFRLKLVGPNVVDDEIYKIYLRSAIDSQRGVITTEQSKLFIQNALHGWQTRWPNMTQKPGNPAFTNFLLEVMGMEPLKV